MYDVIIIGAGPAGISASLYTVRKNLKTLIMYKEKSALEKATKIENYYGFENGISGKELYTSGINQAKKLGAELLEDEVTDIQMSHISINKETKKIENITFKVSTLTKSFEAKSIILATGNKRNKPNIQNIEQFEGKGISYCAVCDGFFYKNKNVAIIGNGDYAVQEAKNLQNIVKETTIFTNGNPEPKNKIPNIKINTKKIEAIEGKEKVQAIKFKDGTTQEIDGIFIAEGTAGSTDFARKLGAKVDKNVIEVNENMQTSVEGLFACGDCVGGISQIFKNVYEGAKAGIAVANFLTNK